MALLTGLVIVSGIFLAADVTMHDSSFEKSFIGRQLQETGGMHYVLLAYEQLSALGNSTSRWVNENAPTYAESAKDYVRLVTDLSKIGYNASKRFSGQAVTYVRENYPIVENWYVIYIGMALFPGPLPSALQSWYIISHAKNVLPSTKTDESLPVIRESLYGAINITQEFSIWAFQSSKTASSSLVDYVKEKMPVAQEAVQTAFTKTQEASKIAGQAIVHQFNTNILPHVQKAQLSSYWEKTQTVASDTWSWLYESVQNISKTAA